MTAAIETFDLTRRFGSVTAVDALNISIATGEIFGLVGPDGAGKTTTLRLLCGLLNPTSGETRFSGQIVRLGSRFVKENLGYMAQRFGLYPDLTVEENLNFYADIFSIEKQARISLMTKLLDMTRMEPYRSRAAGKLSGGMKQKLALMCALIHRPQVLLLDEPTNGVDPVSRRDFWTILYQLVREGLTVVVSTAYLDEAERCSRVAMMYEGRIIRCDTPESLKGLLRDEACYEIQMDAPQEYRVIIEEVPGVLSVELAGASLHVFVSAGLGEEFLKLELSEVMTTPFRLVKIAPSLEDVFIRLIARIKRDSSLAGVLGDWIAGGTDLTNEDANN
jgi:ABC-2 type transport system ATP-binding protein